MRNFGNLERKAKTQPLILKLDSAGSPVRWVPWTDQVIAKFTGKIKWELGDPIQLNGGTGRDGETSKFALYPIMAVDDLTLRKRKVVPPLTNRVLFLRDGHRCAYCGQIYPSQKLSRDHIIPVSKGGKNTWSNCITACKRCNMKKAAEILSDTGMKLLFQPFTPNSWEHLLLQNSKKILECQKEYLLKGVSKYFRMPSEG